MQLEPPAAPLQLLAGEAVVPDGDHDVAVSWRDAAIHDQRVIGVDAEVDHRDPGISPHEEGRDRVVDAVPVEVQRVVLAEEVLGRRREAASHPVREQGQRKLRRVSIGRSDDAGR